MEQQKRVNTVRRNITMDRFMAKKLEAASEFTGKSQGEILETALNQPIMQRLWAFTRPSDGNPIVELLETYQVNEGHMGARIGEGILRPVKKWVTDCAVVKGHEALIQAAPNVNSYIAGHMTEGSMAADPYFKTAHAQAREGVFITPDMDAYEIKGKVTKFIDAILNGPMDKHRMGESYLFRDLLIILSDCFEPPAPEDVDRMYGELADGHVLPYHNIMF